MPASTSRVTQKGQATIPAQIRAILNIVSGDTVLFEVQEDNTVLLRKAKPMDTVYLQSIESTLASEWLSAEDSAAYDDL